MTTIISVPDYIDLETGLNPDGYWYAIDRNTYDVDCDQDGFFSRSPVGHGKTVQEAIAELIEHFEGEL